MAQSFIHHLAKFCRVTKIPLFLSKRQYLIATNEVELHSCIPVFVQNLNLTDMPVQRVKDYSKVNDSSSVTV